MCARPAGRHLPFRATGAAAALAGAAAGGIRGLRNMGYCVVALAAALFGFFGLEYFAHGRNRRRVALRVHVNGTRGKSSVTRLIGAGLRAAGLRTIAKTTGSAAQIILEDGTEEPIVRAGPPRVTEQLGIFRIAAARKADALVLECMALQPYLQYVSERQIIRAHVAVITNVRADHLAVMGPGPDDVALALSGVVPAGGTLVVRQSRYDAFFGRACRESSCRLRIVTDAEVARIGPAELARFAYLEHAENVAVALAACDPAGVDRDKALEGMFAAQPDVGALKLYRGHGPAGRWTFADAFAANDPESNLVLWSLIVRRCPEAATRVVILNCRPDRTDRSRQLGELLGRLERADRYVLAGVETRPALRAALRAGVDAARIADLHGAPAQRVFAHLTEACQGDALLVGMGNIKGLGEELSGRFREASVADG